MKTRRLLFSLVTFSCMAAEKTPADCLVWKVYRIPPGFIGQPEHKLLDASDYLKAAGVDMSEGAEANFDTGRRTLTVHASAAALRQVDKIVVGNYLGPQQMRVVFSLVEFSSADAGGSAPLTYEEARAAAGETWHVLERHSLTSKSGQKVRTNFLRIVPQAKALKNEAKDVADPFTDQFAADEYGAKIEVEPQAPGPKETDFDLSFKLHSRLKRDGVPLLFAAESLRVAPGGHALVYPQTPKLEDAPKATASKVTAVVVEIEMLKASGEPDGR